MKEEQSKMGLTGDEVREQGQGRGIIDLFRATGNSQADPETLASSPDGHLIQERMGVMSMEENSLASKEYWLHYEKGLRKEVHSQVLEKWASYVPVAAEREPHRKFPLIFCLHGAHNPIQLTESYGVMQLAAKEECVVIAPENENLEKILSLLKFAKSHFPVDERRIYAIGYSFGGFMASRLALERPELFAGIGIGGMLFAGDVCGHELDGQLYPAYQLTQEMMQRVEKLEIPILLFMGEYEMLNLLPLWRNPEQQVKDGVIPLASSDKQSAFNRLRQAGGCVSTTFLKEGEEADPVEMAIGARFERTEIREYHGRKYFLGDSVKSDGTCLFRTVACEKMIHWPTTSYAPLVWEQIGKYARDLDTGRLIRL